MDEAGSRAPLLDRHGKSGNDQLGAHVIAHLPTDHIASEQIEDHGEVEPTL